MFPSEINGLIAQTSTKNELSTLARVSRGFQREAERVLYAQLVLDASRGQDQPVLQVLAASKIKGALVKALMIEFSDYALFRHSAYPQMLQALPNMSMLTDLRIRVGWKDKLELVDLQAILG